LICAKCKTDNGRVIAHEKEEIRMSLSLFLSLLSINIYIMPHSRLFLFNLQTAAFSCSKCGHLNVFNKKREENTNSSPSLSHHTSNTQNRNNINENQKIESNNKGKGSELTREKIQETEVGSNQSSSSSNNNNNSNNDNNKNESRRTSSDPANTTIQSTEQKKIM
jgi:hypothetical protein